MSALNPEKLFATIAADIPSSLQSHLYVTGSLAAAYAFQRKLRGNAVNTKDADLVVHPAGHTDSCREIASKLMALGWQPIEGCFPQPDAAPAHELRAIRLQPPTSTDYFLELLNVPSQDQTEPKIWVPVKLADGWYGLPSFRFMGLTAYQRQTSKAGLEYASPAMMALSNALSHPEIGADRIQQGDLAGVLRSSKDLGRVLSLAHLAGRAATEGWPPLWADSMERCFSHTWRDLAPLAASGIKHLISDHAALEEARATTEIGLLNGLNITSDQLAAVGQRLISDALEPFVQLSQRT